MKHIINLRLIVVAVLVTILSIIPHTAMSLEEEHDAINNTYKYIAGWLGAMLSLVIAVYGLNKLVREKTVLRTQGSKEAEGHKR